MRVIGTAGHVDHGKSTLVEALTGIHPDRLKEEQEREMTIDLGFAWVTLPDGEEIGIVDVPGHSDFIENMLAGIGGIDAALFVVASDEGVMPQTREHLAILDLLHIQGGVVALTKTDVVADSDGIGESDAGSDWLDLVEEDVRQVLAGTVLESSPMVRVSARTGEGIPELLRSLSECLAGRPPRPDFGRPRLPVDRIFTIAGFGTVVTGTLSDGRFGIGDELEILPQGLKGRVRGLQTHKRKVDTALPGRRTAINISGLSVDKIRRGDVVALPGNYRPTRRLDVRFRLLPDATQPIKHDMEVKFFHGASEVVARLRLLGCEEIIPGEEGWLQLELRDAVVVVRGDRYILRRPSPGETLGGGVVVEPHPKGRHKRFSSEILVGLDTLAQGSPSDILFQALLALEAAPLKDVLAHSNLDSSTTAQAVEELFSENKLIALDVEQGVTQPLPGNTLVTSKNYWDRLTGRINREVESYHRSYPLRRGMPREELKSRMKISPRLFNTALRRLVNEQIIQEVGPIVLRPGHEIRFGSQQQRAVEELLSRFAATPFAPPSIKQCKAAVGEDVYHALVDLGRLVPVQTGSTAPDVVFSQEGYARMLAEVRRLLEKNGTVTAALVRDHFNTSRRYALAFLEHLDTIGVTVREGDVRRLVG